MEPPNQTGAPVLCFEFFPVPLGASLRAVIVPAFPQTLGEWRRVEVGNELRMYEGPRICGTATVEWIEPMDDTVSEIDQERFCTWATNGGSVSPPS